MAKNKKKKNKVLSKVLAIVFIVAAIGIFYNVLSQIYNMFALQKQAELVEEQLKLLKEENASLVSTKEKLEDPDYVTTYARGEYMFSKSDEKVFYLPSSSAE